MAFPYSVTRRVLTHFLQVDGVATAADGLASMEMDYPGEIIGAYFQCGTDGDDATDSIMIRVDKTTDTDALSATMDITSSDGNNTIVMGSMHATQANREFADGDSIAVDCDAISTNAVQDSIITVICRGR